MKKLILTLLLAPFLVFSQGPSFTITDYEGNIWDSDSILAEGNTIVIQFYSPGSNCWPSAQSIELLHEAYNKYNECNKLFFIQVAEWGTDDWVVDYVNTYSTTDIPTIVGGCNGCGLGYDLTWDWIDNWGLLWAYELWLLRPDGSYIQDIPWAWDTDQQVLIDALENEGFSECNTNVGLEDYVIENNDKNIYDLHGRILDKKPTSGFYVQEGEKYIVIK